MLPSNLKIVYQNYYYAISTNSTMLKTLLIDDQPKITSRIESILLRKFDDIDVTGKADNALQGIRLIAHLKPELIFLDIEMPGGGGFEILDSFPEKNFDVIFVTSHEEYAVKAFKYSAFDYVLKPFSDKDIIDTIIKFKARKGNDSVSNHLERSIGNNTKSGHTSSRIVIPFNNGYEYVKIADIVYLKADGKYCHIYLKDNRRIMASKPINEIHSLINEPTFFKCHKSFVMNVFYTKRFIKTDKYYVETEDEIRIPVARSKKNEFHDIMNKTVPLKMKSRQE